ncbi:hypothetical protein PF005_g17399 [Phytophthora fragariae]|uniref:Uncharacterized protein n=1 Tax=Phytophthora fragariae TaxID=53985 RepID=A0A6A3YWX1_9STRA|nr:hypothetical protein PF003_g6739 [Phytophthora fragariae]KAE8931259.1 hypothetical protein PF009_g18682 [Phytophthora fragariae]KAE8987912.1 hypothetical protein PF011_g19385 [Phytophthora fragariae]KAE9083436.1 hypothetical protein PF007_g21897 [Phytophthora fragariae]KAE9103409.1 hypothetical protein PF010_g13736 [Phytophthora fragariae]
MIKLFNLKFVYFCFVCATYGMPRINPVGAVRTLRNRRHYQNLSLVASPSVIC